MNAFRPFSDQTLKLAVTATPLLVELPFKEGRDISVRFYNESTDLIFVSFGDQNVVANLTTSYPIPGGIVEVVSITGRQGTPRYLSIVKADGTGTLWASIGKGI